MVDTFVRLRPRIGVENDPGELKFGDAVRKLNNSTVLFNPSRSNQKELKFSVSRSRLHFNQRFAFQGVFDSKNSNDDVFDQVAVPKLEKFLAGTNVSVFAYGATGCGKSHTLSTMISRLSAEIFAGIEARSLVGAKLVLSYFEIYGEKPYDLIPYDNSATRPFLKMTRTSEGTKVLRLAHYDVKSPQNMTALVRRGDRNRIVAATKANHHSSRSHSVLSITLSQERNDETIRGIITSTFSIIDLAGNERAVETKNKGLRLKEAGNINKSLLALGQCLKACANNTLAPFRDSCLTRVLQSSLEGGCVAAMIVCISPTFRHFEDTKNSLQYGQTAIAVKRRGSSSSVQLAPLSHSEVVLEGLRNEVQGLTVKLEASEKENKRLEGVIEALERKTAILECNIGVDEAMPDVEDNSQFMSQIPRLLTRKTPEKSSIARRVRNPRRGSGSPQSSIV